MNGETSMRQCQCGAAAAPDALWGLCEECLLKLTFSAPETPPVGSSRRFGGYELGRQIGRGGMGVVYHAVQVSLRRPVALKVILDAELATPQARRRFNIEAEAAARLDHPNIVPIYEFGECEGQPFLSMKLIPGETLREKIASGDLCLQTKPPLSRPETLARAVTIVRLVARVARAAHHAHEHGVLHRDLKPGNILVDPEGQPHLTDFGLAKICEPDLEEMSSASFSETTVGGTPRYMSPEHAAGKCLTAASDIYSLGALFYEMLTTTPPFKGGTVVETLRMIADDAPRRPRSVNPHIEKDLETICIKCLEKNPDARYPSAAALAEDLERWLRGELIQARPAGWILRTARWTHRNRLGSALIVSLCACLALTLVLLKKHSDEQEMRERLEHWTKEKWPQIVTDWAVEGAIRFNSSDLAQMIGKDPRPPTENTKTVTWGIVVNHEPYNQALHYASVMPEIQKRMERYLGYPVLIDLLFFKFNHGGTQSPVTLKKVDFQRLGPLRYAQARESEPGIRALVREMPDKTGVIFARADSGITTLEEVTGRHVAFADTNSTISFLTKANLFQSGVTVRSKSQLDARAELGSSASEELEDRDPEFFAHKEVLRRVLKGDFEVGECSRTHFDKYGRGRLVPLKEFPVPPDVIVARAGLDRRLADAFQEALCSFKTDEELTQLRRIRVGDGYEPASDSDYKTLRSLAEDVRKFEASH